MVAENDVVIENKWTPFQRFAAGRHVDSAHAQVALLNAGASIKKRLGLRADPFRFRGSGAGIELQVFGVAGSISLSGISLQIVPKFVEDATRLVDWDVSSLFILDALAGKHVISLIAHRQKWQSHRVLDLIAYAFADAAERGLRDQPIHIYRQREESTVALRGRLNLGRQLRNSINAPHLLECDFDQLDTENAFNDILKWAATTLMESAREKALKTRLRLVVDSIPGDPQRSANYRHARLMLPPQFQTWHDALELSRLLASGMVLSKGGGRGAGYSLLFNMERAFERFVEVVLNQCINTNEDWTSSRQEWITYATPQYEGGKVLRCRPDNVVRRAGIPLMVVDAKYKLLDEELSLNQNDKANGAPASLDVYELLGGMVAHNCDLGLLIYPSSTGSSSAPAIRIWHVSVYGKLVRIGALAVDLLTLTSRTQMAKVLALVSDHISNFGVSKPPI